MPIRKQSIVVCLAFSFGIIFVVFTHIILECVIRIEEYCKGDIDTLLGGPYSASLIGSFGAIVLLGPGYFLAILGDGKFKLHRSRIFYMIPFLFGCAHLNLLVVIVDLFPILGTFLFGFTYASIVGFIFGIITYRILAGQFPRISFLIGK